LANELHDDNEVGILNQVYEVHRLCAFNSDYFAWKAKIALRSLQALDFLIEGLIIATTIMYI
jgi:hypothetical protein